jgi:hypothetical protein
VRFEPFSTQFDVDPTTAALRGPLLCKYASVVSRDGRPEREFRNTARSFKEDFMNRKLVIALCLFTAIPAVGQAQNPPPAPPKPTLADVQKVVQIVSADKAKLQAYCDLAKLNDQIAAADQKKDTKTVEALSKQADALEEKMGPDYAKVMDGLYQVDENSPLGKQISAALDTLDKQCK